MALDNHPLDSRLRDRGTYRKRPVSEVIEDAHHDYTLKSQCNNEEYEDALIAALDAGLTSEEISDILLGSSS